jgi:hypothetical protein
MSTNRLEGGATRSAALLSRALDGKRLLVRLMLKDRGVVDRNSPALYEKSKKEVHYEAAVYRRNTDGLYVTSHG